MRCVVVRFSRAFCARAATVTLPGVAAFTSLRIEKALSILCVPDRTSRVRECIAVAHGWMCAYYEPLTGAGQEQDHPRDSPLPLFSVHDMNSQTTETRIPPKLGFIGVG